VSQLTDALTFPRVPVAWGRGQDAYFADDAPVGSITPGVCLALHQTASTGTRGTPQLFAGPGRLRRASIDGALRFEELLVVPRVLVGIAVALMSVLVPGVWVPGLLGVGGYFVAISAVAAHRLTVIPPDRGPFLWTSAADTAGCFAVLIVLGAAAEPPGVLLFPLLAFELALKYCVRGTAVALGLLTVSIGLRLAYRADHFGAAPRVWLILLLLATTGLLVGVAGVLRASERRRWQAVEDRRRLARLLRETVEATLNQAGIRRRSPGQREDLLALVEQACAHPELSGDITRRLAAAVAPTSTGSGPLSSREDEVLGLVAEGLTNREIAARLFLSPGTVRVHMSNVAHKLHVSGRAEAVRWYAQRSKAATPE